MFIMDVPATPPQETPIVLVQAGSTATAAPQPDFILNNCQETEPTGDPQSALRGISPSAALRGYFEDRDNKLLDLALFKPSLLQGAKHGKITEGVDKDNLGFTYDPDIGYFGDDQAIFMVEFEGKRYKVIYQIKVMEYVPDDTTCPPPTLIKVTKPSSGDSGFGAGYTLGSVGVSFADLLGAAVGQTVGSTITLDTNASGYNCFIDTTPADNSEFLPTSNPNEWVAKAGSGMYC